MADDYRAGSGPPKDSANFADPALAALVAKSWTAQDKRSRVVKQRADGRYEVALTR